MAGKRGEVPRFPTDRQDYPQSIRTMKAKLTLIMLERDVDFTQKGTICRRRHGESNSLNPPDTIRGKLYDHCSRTTQPI
jgi:hypothetical protein